MYFKRNTKLTLASMIGILSSSSILAQESDLADLDLALEEIIVTAQKRSESVRDVPIAMTVASKEQIKRDQIYSLTDMQRLSPSLEVIPTSGGESNGGARIRGLGTSLFNSASNASVAIVVDQVPSGNIAAPANFDLAQIEVLKGPQGTLFGQTASLGVVNISSAAPDSSEFAIDLGADYLFDDYDQTLVRGMVNVPLTENSALRIAARIRQEEGLQTNVKLGKDNETDETALRVRYRIEPSDELMIDLIGEYQKVEQEGQTFFATATPPDQSVNLPFPPFAPLPAAAIQAGIEDCGMTIREDGREFCSDIEESSEREFMSISAIVDWAISDSLSFTSVTSYKEKENPTYAVDLGRTDGTFTASFFDSGEDSEQFSQEFRLTSNNDSGLNYVAGVYFHSFEAETLPLSDAAFGDCANPIGFTIRNAEVPGGVCLADPVFEYFVVDTDSESLFFDATYDFDEKWTAFGGLRYTSQETEFGAGINSLTASNSQTVDDEEITGRIGSRYLFGEDNMAYVTYATGFKPSYVATNPNPEVGAQVLDAEESSSIELGTKLGLFNNRVAVDANVFFTEVDNFQTQALTFAGSELVSTPVNVDVESKGLEVETYGRATENLTLRAGILYNIVEYPSGFLGDDGSDLSGEQLALSPKTKFTLSSEYAANLSDNLGFFFNVNGVYKTEIRTLARTGDKYTYPSHWNLGASLGLESPNGDWRVSIFGRNLTDEAEPVGALPALTFGQEDGAIRHWPFGGVTVRQLGVTFDLRF